MAGKTFRQLSEDLWLLGFPLTLLGADLRRNVAIVRLRSGHTVIHSTAPFTADDVEKIASCGTPGWIVEAMRDHDTFARQGRESFPALPYLAPPGFSDLVGFPTTDLLPAPSEWGDELLVHRVAGIPSFDEHVFFHPASRTLIVADLVFNFGDGQPLWSEILITLGVGSQHEPGMSRRLRLAIKDKEALRQSLAHILTWDFDRVIVGHGDPIETGGHAKVQALFERFGLLPG